MTVVELLKSQLIPLTDAVLCVNCGIVSDAGGETCPGCAGRGGLLNLAVIVDHFSWACVLIGRDRGRKGNC